MAETEAPGPSNSLGLDFDSLKIQDSAQTEISTAETIPDDVPQTQETAQSSDAAVTEQESQSQSQQAEVTKEKKKPYVNLERVKTGGPQREKPSDEELAAKMARIKEQNEKIKQRRLDVIADEEAFQKTTEVERAKQAHMRKVQEQVNRDRQQSERRKMDKIQSREWDAGKPAGDRGKPREPTNGNNAADTQEEGASAGPSPTHNFNGSRGGRGFGRGRGRGRGRGFPEGKKNGQAVPSPKAEKPSEETKLPAQSTSPAVSTET